MSLNEQISELLPKIESVKLIESKIVKYEFERKAGRVPFKISNDS